MPHLRILTNKHLSGYKMDQTIAAASKLVSENLQKPEDYVMVSIQDQTTMRFAGTDDAAAYIHLESIGFNLEPTELAPILCAFAEQHLGVPSSRTYVNFVDLDREMYGWNGSTFE